MIVAYSRYSPCMFLDVLRKTAMNLNEESREPGRNSNRFPPK